MSLLGDGTVSVPAMKSCRGVDEQRHLMLWHCATDRKVAGSIPDGVIAIFQLFNPSGRTMALGSTQPVTFMGIRNISWRVKAAGV